MGVLLLLLALGSPLGTLGCRCSETDATPLPKPSSARVDIKKKPSVTASPQSASSPFAEPEALLRLPTPAYHTQLAVTSSAIHLYSALGLHTLTQTSPPAFIALPSFSVAALDSSRLIGFGNGAFLEVLLSDPKAHRVLGRTTRAPQLLAQHAGQPVWTTVDANGKTEVLTLAHGQSRSIYAARGTVTSLTTLSGRAYFVEQAPVTEPGKHSWTLLSIALDGGAPSFGPSHAGRTPSTLHTSEQIFYYHGPERNVFRTSRDFAVEQVAARDIICSPLFAVVHADSKGELYCAQLGGVTLVELASSTRQSLPLHPSGPITTLAVGEPGLVYVVDSGREQLEMYLSAPAH